MNGLFRSGLAVRLGNASRAYYVFLSLQLVAILLLIAWYCMIYQKDRAENLKRLRERLVATGDGKRSRNEFFNNISHGTWNQKGVNGRFICSSVESRQNGRRNLTLNVSHQKDVAMSILLRANCSISIATLPSVRFQTVEVLDHELAGILSVFAAFKTNGGLTANSDAALAMASLRLRGIMRGYDEDGVLRLKSLSACKSLLQDAILYNRLENQGLRELLEDIVLFYGGELQHDATVIISKVLAICPVEGQQALMTLIAYADDDTAVSSILRLIAYRLPMAQPTSREAQTILKMLLIIISRPRLNMAHHDDIKRALREANRSLDLEVRNEAQFVSKKYKELHSFVPADFKNSSPGTKREVCV